MKRRRVERFDELVQDAIEGLPSRYRRLIDEIPVVVLDRPTPEMLRDVGVPTTEADELCGLHTGTAITERGVERHGELPTVIHLFRNGIVSLAGGWDHPQADERIYEEIRITLLHEIGHHFGLDEEDLEELGYD
jgi:predicted Zn-dependent protease with MMP-like domain